MTERPSLDKNLASETFRQFYYLKEELVDFCRENELPVSGGKIEITERIACFLETGVIPAASKVRKRTVTILDIQEDTKIESDFVCSEKHRAFFKKYIGERFSFNVTFQKWLKSNTGKTYKEAITAYNQILQEQKKGKKGIDRQFEYNTYIRDFFEENQGKSLQEAIKCWKYKKKLKGNHCYEQSDLEALEE